MDDGEDPVTTAVREVAEESGCILDRSRLDLVAVADVTQAGKLLNRSWNYTAIATESSLRPRQHHDETVTEADWFARDDAAALLTRSSYPPKIEPAVRFLSTGERVLKWTFELLDTSGNSPTFQWDPPTLQDQQ